MNPDAICRLFSSGVVRVRLTHCVARWISRCRLSANGAPIAASLRSQVSCDRKIQVALAAPCAEVFFSARFLGWRTGSAAGKSRRANHRALSMAPATTIAASRGAIAQAASDIVPGSAKRCHPAEHPGRGTGRDAPEISVLRFPGTPLLKKVPWKFT